MDEKRTIIDELWTQARIYLDEQAEMVTKTVRSYDDTPDSCSKCRGSFEEIYVRSEELTSWNGYDLIVLKCQKCRLLYAFWIQPFSPDETHLFSAKGDEHVGRRIEPPKWEYVNKPEWGEGRQPKFSKKTVKTYERTSSQLEGVNKKMNPIIQSKLAEMYGAGLGIETINSARNKVADYLRNNSTTSNQLVSLLTAAIYEASHEELVGVDGLKRVGEKISERELEKVFGVTRKTIRKCIVIDVPTWWIPSANGTSNVYHVTPLVISQIWRCNLH